MSAVPPVTANNQKSVSSDDELATSRVDGVDAISCTPPKTQEPVASSVGFCNFSMSDSCSSSSSCTSRTVEDSMLTKSLAKKEAASRTTSHKFQTGQPPCGESSCQDVAPPLPLKLSSSSSDSPTKTVPPWKTANPVSMTSNPVSITSNEQQSSVFSFSTSPGSLSASDCTTSMSTTFLDDKKQSQQMTDQKLKQFNGWSASSMTIKTSSTPVSANKSSKLESLKEQKKNYRFEKKRAAKELMSTLKDSSIIIMAEWLKVRGSLKSWTKFWCVLKPGLLLLYKSNKMKAFCCGHREQPTGDIHASESSHWVATVLLNTCELLERPSKKDGFCFKLFHPLDQSIWATKGPTGEAIGALTQPLPYSYLIFRAPADSIGKCWMDALELAIHCSSLMRPIARTDQRDVNNTNVMASSADCDGSLSGQGLETSSLQMQAHNMDESECEKHFRLCDEDLLREQDDHDEDRTDRSDSDDEYYDKDSSHDDSPPVETFYERNTNEELGQGDSCQTEEVADEHKSLIWTLVKQVRPGMDLSKVVLPTFILEPRSFLDKLADFYYHADLLSEAMLEEDPFTRMKLVVRWYLSGFYKKPKGLKKPYNPILGEALRCYWKHPKTDSRTFYIAEQISHHPPVSAFYVTNRKDGFAITGSILAKSKFYGNSLSAILDGVARLVFLKRGEDYLITMPYAHCKGILIGTLTSELGGVVSIKCEKTGYSAELEFKLKPFLGSDEASNCIGGKIRLGEETLANITGHWDQEIFIKDKRSEEKKTLWNSTPEVKSQRLPRFTVPTDAQADFESERLWQSVSDAIHHGDETTATSEKFILEEDQRRASRERKAKMEDWVPRFFERNIITGDWVYKFSDLRPWDTMNDVIQYERDFVIQTKTRHQTPIVHTTSITAAGGGTSDDKMSSGASCGHSRQSSLDHVLAVAARTKRLSVKRHHTGLHVGGPGRTSTPCSSGVLSSTLCDSESSLSAGELRAVGKKADKKSLNAVLDSTALASALQPLQQQQMQTADQLSALTARLTALHTDVTLGLEANRRRGNFGSSDFLITMAIMLLLQAVIFGWLFRPASNRN